MTEYAWTLFGQVDPGITLGAGGQTDITHCLQFSLSQDARVTAIWWYSPSSATVLPQQCGIFLVSTQALILVNDNPAWSGTAGSGWVSCTFDGTFPLFAGYEYQVAVYTSSDTDYYGETASFWSSGGTGENGLTNGIITAPSNSSASVGQNSYIDSSANLTYPDTGSGNNVWLDVQVTTGIPAPSPPVAGFALASPRSWSPGDQVTVPRLRGDVYSLAALTGPGRPLFEAQGAGTISDNTVALTNQNNSIMNSWNTVLTQGAAVAFGPGTATFYPVPLPGWYLIQASTGLAPISGGTENSEYDSGIIYTQGTALFATRQDLSQVTGTPSGAFSAPIGNSSAELIPLNPGSGDVVGAYGFCAFVTDAVVNSVWSAEWVALPSSGTINGVPYTGPVGTVVASPKPVSPWPPGPGGTLNAAVSAGGSVLALGPVPGLRAGGTIGVDWMLGQQYQAYAETAAVQSVAGGTVTLSGTLSYAHSAGAPVAVPVSAAFLNEQVRDQSNFWFYPPMLRAIQGTASAQSVPTSTWTTINLALTGAGIVNTVDNFSGWEATTTNYYTIPVSGLYLVIGQVYFVGSTAATNWGAALIDNNGVRYQGDMYASDSTGGALAEAPAVRRLLRLTAGQTIALQGWQSSGASVNTDPQQTFTAESVDLFAPRLIVLLRAL